MEMTGTDDEIGVCPDDVTEKLLCVVTKVDGL